MAVAREAVAPAGEQVGPSGRLAAREDARSPLEPNGSFSLRARALPARACAAKRMFVHCSKRAFAQFLASPLRVFTRIVNALHVSTRIEFGDLIS